MLIVCLLLFLLNESLALSVVAPSKWHTGRGRLMTQRAKEWQEDLDLTLDIDTDCDTRRDKVVALFGKLGEISKDVQEAIRSGDLTAVAPETTGYGKALVGLEALQRQVVSDIIPDLISKGPKYLPQMAENLSKQPRKEGGALSPPGISELLEEAQSFSRDPSRIQNTVNTLTQEVRNVFKSIPDGLESPEYIVKSATDDYEIRAYETYAVCRTSAGDTRVDDDNQGGTTSIDKSDMMTSGNNFNVLAGYIFGDNADREKIAMTTPVITRGDTMEFVLARGFTAANAPVPNSDKVMLASIPARVLAVRSFPGIATEGEVSRQRAVLEDALLAAGVVYDNLSFQVSQFNPPYTLPWLRLNEVSLCVHMPDGDAISDLSGSEEGEGELKGEQRKESDEDPPENGILYETSPDMGD